MQNYSSPVRLAVVGAGLIGQRHIQHIIEEQYCTLISIVESHPNAVKLAAKTGVAYFSNVTDFLNKSDAEGVIIATPSETHSDIGIQCAQAGLHLLVEKPIDTDLDRATSLVETAHRAGVKLLIGHHRRFNSYIETAKEIIDSGQLGTVTVVNVFWTALKPARYFDLSWRRKEGGGLVLINLIHEIDNLRYLFGDIERLYAETNNAIRSYPVEDTAVVSIRFCNGILGSVVATDSAASPYNFESGTGENPMIHTTNQDCYRIFGSRATLNFPEITIWQYPKPGEQGWSDLISQECRAVAQTIPLQQQLKHFCDIIRHGGAPRCSGEDGMKALEAALAIKKSTKTRSPVILR